MSFKQYLKAEIVDALDETYRVETWVENYPGRSYFDVHLSTIENHDTTTPTVREFLGGGGLRILESGCGSGRWMAFFEKLGNVPVGLDDSWGPLRVAREHASDMNLVRADALASPFRDGSFDAAFSCYVAEHFPQGPEELFREIRRTLKPGGLFLVSVPYDNVVRRFVVNPILRFFYLVWKLRGRALGFTEFRYTREEMDGFLQRSGFEILRVMPDEYRLPWSKGFFVDLCDVGSFFLWAPKPPYELPPGRAAVARFLQWLGPWVSCGGIFYVARVRR